MAEIPVINMNDYDYKLPQEKIAQFPVDKRDHSKLLVMKNGRPEETRFFEIPDYLPSDSILVYNQTRVIRARLLFEKETGAMIEIFCLEPVEPTHEPQQAFECKSGVTWKCLVGNSKRWKSGSLVLTFEYQGKICQLVANRLKKKEDHSLVEFTWEPQDISFSEVILQTGTIPLPPYMHRNATSEDNERYQTVYARSEGSVAAPTAGLHFTDEILEKIRRKNITTAEVTLHVGAGTFKPVGSNDVREHEMHTEKVIISRKTIEMLLNKKDQKVIVTGTTSLRTLESLYIHGVKLAIEEYRGPEMDVKQWDPYSRIGEADIPLSNALEAVIKNMDHFGIDKIHGQTQLMIMPGYHFRIADILITNFHMPRSTLLLLVAAFIGNDWKKAYEYALSHQFRFLSYGDACLFFKNP